jgi:hypothetical protein
MAFKDSLISALLVVAVIIILILFLLLGWWIGSLLLPMLVFGGWLHIVGNWSCSCSRRLHSFKTHIGGFKP